MRAATQWKDYELIDATAGNRLERWGQTLLVRPDPSGALKTPRAAACGKGKRRVSPRCHRRRQWEYRRKMPEKWTIGCEGLRLIVSPTGFKHTGVFPEQAVNWALPRADCRGRARGERAEPVYTGGATLACGSRRPVCHVDASRGMVAWARDNAAESGLAGRPIRWIVDDCAKFVAREQRRGTKYDAIIMDPPSYGRGPGGEVGSWRTPLTGLLRPAPAC